MFRTNLKLSIIVLFVCLAFFQLGNCLSKSGNADTYIDVTAANVWGSSTTQQVEKQILQLLKSKQGEKDEKAESKIEQLMKPITDACELEKLAFWSLCVIDDVYVLPSVIEKLYPKNIDTIYEIGSIVRADGGIAESINDALNTASSRLKQPVKKAFHPTVNVWLDCKKTPWTCNPIDPTWAALQFNLTCRIRSHLKAGDIGNRTLNVNFDLDKNGQPLNISVVPAGSIKSIKPVIRDQIKSRIKASAPFFPLPNSSKNIHVDVAIYPETLPFEDWSVDN